MLKLGFIFHTSFEAKFMFYKELKVRFLKYFLIFRVEARLFFNSQGWGQIICFATYQSKKIVLTYRLGQIIFFNQKQRQMIFSKTLPAFSPDNEMVALWITHGDCELDPK